MWNLHSLLGRLENFKSAHTHRHLTDIEVLKRVIPTSSATMYLKVKRENLDFQELVASHLEAQDPL
jgi:hypothetical protein